jgi:general secretion pathway protein G
LLFPTLGKARGKGRQITCLSNLRQLSAAIHLYTGDYRGVLPHSTSDPNDAGCWFYAVDSYLLGSVSDRIPIAQQKLAAFKQDPIWFTFDANSRANWRTIKMNRKLVGKDLDRKETDDDPPYRSIYRILNHSTTPLFFDGTVEKTGSLIYKTRTSGWEKLVELRHSGGANIAFVDGHAECWNKGKPQTGAGQAGWDNDTTGLTWWAE